MRWQNFPKRQLGLVWNEGAVPEGAVPEGQTTDPLPRDGPVYPAHLLVTYEQKGRKGGRRNIVIGDWCSLILGRTGPVGDSHRETNSTKGITS